MLSLQQYVWGVYYLTKVVPSVDPTGLLPSASIGNEACHVLNLFMAPTLRPEEKNISQSRGIYPVHCYDA